MTGALTDVSAREPLRSSLWSKPEMRRILGPDRDESDVSPVILLTVDRVSQAHADVDEDGTHAAARLDIAHFALASRERAEIAVAPPSDRWYRLFEQMESFTSSGEVYLFASALFFDEVDKFREWSDSLPRHDRRAEVRDRVASELESVTQIAGKLLLRACEECPAQASDVQFLGSDVCDLGEDPDREQVNEEGLVALSDALTPRKDLPDQRGWDVVLAGLVPDAMAGDRRARDQLLAEIRPMVVRYCRARLGRQETGGDSPDDVAQEVCLAVLNALPTYPLKGLPFRAFVYGIAARKVTDTFRAIGRYRTEPVPELPDTPVLRGGPEQHALESELGEMVGRLLHLLTARQREVLVLRIAVGLSAEETAQAVGSTPGAVRVTQHRALNRLRGVIGRTTRPVRDHGVVARRPSS